MRCLTVLLATSLVGAAMAQEGSAAASMMQPVPAEMKQVEFMLGDWEAKKLAFYFQGKSEGEGTAKTSMRLNGRYLVSHHTYSMAGMPGTMEGLHVMNYEPAKKAFVAYWFDGSSPGAMEMSGDFEGDTLTMVSKPTAIEGMGEMVMRSTWVKKSDSEVSFKLEMKQGENWAPMMEGIYTKKK